MPTPKYIRCTAPGITVNGAHLINLPAHLTTADVQTYEDMRRHGLMCPACQGNGMVEDAPLDPAPQSLDITAAELQAGDVITCAGKTSYAGSQSITVTRTELSLFGTGVIVWGRTLRNSEPRLMFRSLLPNLPVKVVRS